MDSCGSGTSSKLSLRSPKSLSGGAASALFPLQLLQSLLMPMTEHFIPPHPRDLPACTESPHSCTSTCSGQSCCSLQPTTPLQTCQQSSFPAGFSFSITQVLCLALSHLFSHASSACRPLDLPPSLLPCCSVPEVLPRKHPSHFTPVYPFHAFCNEM